jgi:PAS domain S-box-containing protein
VPFVASHSSSPAFVEEGVAMRVDKERILSRLMVVFMTATLAFLLYGVPPGKAQGIQLRHTNLISLLPVGRDAPNLHVSRLDLGIGNAETAGEDGRGDAVESRGDDSPVRTVRVGIYQNPPKVFIDENGNPSGIFIDLLDKIARQEKWNLVYVPCEWSECLEALEEHRIDLMPDVAYSRERDQLYDFHAIPVVDSWSQVYANSSIRVSTLSDLNGRRIAVLKGGIQERLFEEMMNGFGFEVTIIPAETYEEAFSLTSHGYADAAISNHLIGDYLFRRYGLTKTPIVFNPTSLYFVTAQGRNSELLGAVDRHLKAWRSEPDSHYYRTLACWMEKPPEQVVPRYLIWILVITGGCLLLSFGIIQLLRAQVRAKTRHLVTTNESLRESEEKYRLLVENLNDVIFCLDATGNIIYLSPVAERLFVYRPKEIIGKPFSEFVHPDELPGLLKSRGETLGGRLEPYEFRLIDKNGGIHYVMTSSRPIEKDGRNVGMTGVLTDITDRKRTEEALRESEERHRTILDTIEDGYFEVDLKGSFTSFNASTRAMLGYDHEEMVGLNYRQYMAKEVSDKVFLIFNEVFETGIPAKAVDWRLIRKDGTVMDIETSLSLRRDNSGAPIGFFGIARDLTEKKKMELQLLQTEKLSAVGTMISGVAHELNNPLTAIIGNAQLLARQGVTEDVQGKLDVILQESIRSSKIVGGLLAFAREHKPERSMVNLNSIILESVRLKEYDLKVNNIDLELSLADNLPETSADPYQIQQVFINLINNARDALVTDQGAGTLTIRTYNTGTTIMIEFEDTGPGIPDEIINRIFEPFFTTKETGKGTGLGLSMAYGIIGEHGGTISVVSKPGKGARFTISVPIASVEEVAVAEREYPPGEQRPHASTSILVVEDEDNLAQFISEALSDEGYHVTCCNNGKAAIEKLEKHTYDLIISDMKMPGMSGVELYQYIHKHHPKMTQKVLFMTGDVLGKDTQDFLTIAGHNYIEKPFEIVKLLQAIRRIIQRQ